MNIRKLQAFIVLTFTGLIANAQEIEMADDFRGEGKIYVVVAVVLSLIIGIFVQLMRLENKVKSLEKENEGSN
ncbi:MAG: CcmD family protein [Cyclobacteriaceae bacterium]